MKQYNHLNVPSHWQHYWSRFPEGHTIVEALIQWVSQVDDMVDNVNDWNVYLDGFVESFDTEIQNTVAGILDEWNKTGLLQELVDKWTNERIDTVEQKQSYLENTKIGEGVLATMSDLGTDVKTAMTGGSVAVVGVGAVNNTTINDRQVTPDKLTHKVVINKQDLPIHRTGAYVDALGEFTEHTNWNTREYVIPDSAVRIDLVGTISSHKPVIKYDDGTIYSVPNTNFTNKINTHNGTLLLNENISSPATDITSIVVYFSEVGYISEVRYNLIGEKTLHDKGYMTSTGEVKFAVGFSIYRVDIEPYRTYKASLTVGANLQGALFSATDTLIGGVSVASDGTIPTGEASYMLVTVTTGDQLYSELSLDVDNNEQLYPSTVQKPYSFSAKKGVLFGDSIAEGNTVVDGIAPNPFFKQVGDAVGMTTTNRALSGSLFTEGFNDVETITARLTSTDLTPYDFVFVAGGTNDYTMGATLTQFRNRVTQVCEHLKTNFTGEVIFITPINRPRPGEQPTASLDAFRKALSEIVLSYNYGLIDGSEIPIPETYGTYQEKVIPDGLHPNQLGHTLYANRLLTVLT